MNPKINHPPVDPENYPYHIGNGEFSLRDWLNSGEQIVDLVNEDPEMWKLEQFINLYDLNMVIRAWCLCNGIDPNQYPTLSE